MSSSGVTPVALTGREAYALAQLRRLYAQMLCGAVQDCAEAARELLGPSIEILEAAFDGARAKGADGGGTLGKWISHETFEERETLHGLVYLLRRAAHCDRGRFVAQVWPVHGRPCQACDMDSSDGFPRYYFDAERAKAELQAWIEVRGWDR